MRPPSLEAAHRLREPWIEDVVEHPHQLAGPVPIKLGALNCANGLPAKPRAPASGHDRTQGTTRAPPSRLTSAPAPTIPGWIESSACETFDSQRLPTPMSYTLMNGLTTTCQDEDRETLTDRRCSVQLQARGARHPSKPRRAEPSYIRPRIAPDPAPSCAPRSELPAIGCNDILELNIRLRILPHPLLVTASLYSCCASHNEERRNYFSAGVSARDPNKYVRFQLVESR